MEVRKSDGSYEEFDRRKLTNIIKRAYKSANVECDAETVKEIIDSLYVYDGILCSSIRKQIQERLGERNEDVLHAYQTAKERRERLKDFVTEKIDFIETYKKSDNTANATIDDNSNVSSKNIGILNAEIHKRDNIEISRAMIMDKLKVLYPNFNCKNYKKDLEHHIIYKNDENSFAGAISPYCVSITMYPFITDGIKKLGGLSAAPKNIDSFCGMFVNLIFAIAAQFAGAVAVPEALVFFAYFAKKEWGDDFWQNPDKVISCGSPRQKTIRKQIRQYFQQIVYSICQPAASRGMQSAFVNFAYFDKNFFEGMFGNFYFPDGTKPDWESTSWIQKEFMMWFNEERTKCILTFPVESFALVYKDGHFLDQESADFVAEEYARGHSFFTYISDTVDSLSSCCFDGNTRIMYAVEGSKTFEKCVPIKDAYEKECGKSIKVLGYDPYTLKREWVKGKFIKTTSSELYKIVLLNRTCDWTYMTVTADHIFPVLRNGNTIEIEARYLTETDLLLVDKAQWDLSEEDFSEISYVSIKSIERIDDERDVYCVELDDKRSPYFVLSNGVITHNCRLKNKIQTKEFNFTNGNMGVQTGSKSVISLNLSRIIQDWFKSCGKEKFEHTDKEYESLNSYINKILERVYKYHTAYNELLWDMYDARLLPVYKAGFIDLNKQYLTIGLNGLNQAAEFLGMTCNDNKDYSKFCTTIFGNIKEQNTLHKVTEGRHKLTFNTECVPAESLAVKNYNWDKEDGYWVPDDTNLYASYIYKPNDSSVSMLEKIRLHGKNYIGDYLDGGSAAHLGLEEHLSAEQYKYLLKYAADNGCQYLTWNVPNCECEDCHYIAKTPFDKCPRCGSTNVSKWDRIIGYLTKIKNWSAGRQIEQKTRIYENGSYLPTLNND